MYRIGWLFYLWDTPLCVCNNEKFDSICVGAMVCLLSNYFFSVQCFTKQNFFRLLPGYIFHYKCSHSKEKGNLLDFSQTVICKLLKLKYFLNLDLEKGWFYGAHNVTGWIWQVWLLNVHIAWESNYNSADLTFVNQNLLKL